MVNRLQLRTLIFVVCTALGLVASAVRAAEIPVVTGEIWIKSSVDVKKAYLVGIANLMQVETAYYAANPPTQAQNFVPQFVKGLQGQTLDGVREKLDHWYASNPGRLQRPVIETIWFEMAKPGLH